MRPPSGQSLRRHVQHQGLDQGKHSIEQIRCDSDAVEDEDSGLILKQCAPRNSKGWRAPTTINLAFYPPGWKVVLSRAKDEFLYHIAATHPFPECASHLHEAEHILNNHIESYEEDHGALEDGLCAPFIFFLIIAHNLLCRFFCRS
jgi:hypothetical protein